MERFPLAADVVLNLVSVADVFEVTLQIIRARFINYFAHQYRREIICTLIYSHPL